MPVHNYNICSDSLTKSYPNWHTTICLMPAFMLRFPFLKSSKIIQGIDSTLTLQFMVSLLIFWVKWIRHKPVNTSASCSLSSCRVITSNKNFHFLLIITKINIKQIIKTQPSHGANAVQILAPFIMLWIEYIVSVFIIIDTTYLWIIGTF